MDQPTMSYTFSSSFNYTPDVVDFEAMNITDMFPEQSSFSFDISNSYSDSISGIPLAQQALWDDGQLTLPNSSRVFNASSLSSSVNSSINYGHPHQHQQQYHNGQQHQPQPQQQQQQQQQSPRHLLVPSSHHGRHTHPHPLSQQQQYQGSPLRADDGYLGSSQDDENNEESGYNVHGDESSGHLGWMDDTKDQQGMMLHYNDQERRDEQHLQFLQDIGAGSLSRGDSISLFDKLDDASELSCDLFKEEIDIDETGDQSRLPFNNAGGHFENEIFDREFMASLKTAPTSFSPMDSPNNNSSIRRNPNNILDGLHSIPAPVLDHDESINIGHRKRGTRYDGSERSGTGETYQRALKSFFDSLKVADPIKTPHKFAPQPLPILWNEPKIRSKNLPSFNLADYKDVAKSTMVPGTPPAQFKSMTTAFKSAPLSATTGLSNRLNGNKRDSFSSSPTNTHSMPNSAHSSPLSSMSTSPPTASLRSKMPIADPMTPTAATYNSKLTHSPSQPQQQLQQLQQQQPETEQEPPQRLSPTPQRYSPTPQQQLSPTTSEQRVRSKRRSTIVNPHLAFDPTIPPSEREKTEELKTPTTTPRGTLERRSTLQQAARPKLSAPEDPKSDEDAGVSGQQQQHQQGTLGRSGSAIMSGLRGPAVRKRRSLHQDMFTNDLNQDDQVHQQQHPREEFQDDDQDIHQQQQQHQQQDGGLNHRGSRPLSANILPESLTSVNNHAIHKESANVERVRRLSEEERGQQGDNVNGVALAPGTPTSRLPAALTLGRAAGARFGRSGSGSTGSLAQMSPTTPTAANPYGSLSGRTAATALAGRQANSADQPHRLSLTGMTAAFARQQLDDAAAADSPSTPTQSQYMPKLQQSPSTLSRSDTRSSPPSAGLRRPGYATQEPDFQKDYGGGGGSSNLSSPTEQYDDYYRAEKEFQMQQQQQQQQPVRSSYLRHQLQKQQDQENEWYGDEEPRRMPTSPMKTRQAPSLDQQHEQRDQKHLQRLRIQQQALEDVYGHGAGYGGNDYADDQGFVDDRLPSALPQQQPQHSRYQSQLSPRHQHHSPPSPLSPSSRDYLSMNATTPKAGSHQQQSRYSPPMPSSALPLSSSTTTLPRASDHYRRQSKDGYSLMSAPRISPPLTALPTTRVPSSLGLSNGANPRRPLSQGMGSQTLPSRRLSTAANVGGGDGMSNGTIGLHGRSGSSGSSLQRSSTYGSQPPLSGAVSRGSAVPSAYSDGNLTSSIGRRSLPQSSTSRRSASESLSSSSHVRASTTAASSSSSSEYARVFNPQRSTIAGPSGGNQYQHHQQQEAYTYRPEVPLRQSSLASGLGARSSMASLRGTSGNGGSSGNLHGLAGSSSQLRRAASMNVAPGGLGGLHGGGSGSLGRASGLLPAGTRQSSYQPQQPAPLQQRYQRSSVYSHRS